MFHDPELGQTAIWASTSDELTWGPIVEDVVEAMVPSLASDEES